MPTTEYYDGTAWVKAKLIEEFNGTNWIKKTPEEWNGSTWEAIISYGTHVFLSDGSTVKKVATSDGSLIWTNTIAKTMIGLSCDPNGVVAVGSTDYLRKINADGTTAWDVVESTGPYLGAIDQNGNCYVLKTNEYVLKYSSTGSFVWEVVANGGVNTGNDYGVDAEGNVYFVSTRGSDSIANEKAMKILADGSGYDFIRITSAKLWGLSVNPDADEIYLSDNSDNSIHKVRRSDMVLLSTITATASYASVYLTRAKSGNFYIFTEGFTVAKFNSSGSKLWEVAVGDNSYSSPELDEDENVYVACVDHILYKISADGSTKTTVYTMSTSGYGYGLDVMPGRHGAFPTAR